MDVKNLMFHCLGHTVKKQEFHSQGFLKASPTSFCEDLTNGSIVLFGCSYSYRDALPSFTEEIFNNCRKSFWLLFTRPPEKEKERNYIRLREDISSFLNYLWSFLGNCSSMDGLGGSFLDDFEEYLWFLRLLLKKFSFLTLPNFALNSYPSKEGNESSDYVYNLIHCHLDARWLIINIIQELQFHRNQFETASTQITTSQYRLVLEEEVMRLISELLSLAVTRYENIGRSAIGKIDLFYCCCFKELWVLLMHFSYRKEGFWLYLTQCLRMFLDNPAAHIDPEDLDLTPLRFPACNNRREFVLWFCSGLAVLQQYDNHGNYVGVANTENTAVLEMVDETVKAMLQDGDGPSESCMRQLMPLLIKIHRFWGHTMCGSLFHLWEYYFHAKINSAFYVSGSNVNSTIVVSSSGKALLDDVKTRLDRGKRDENSFFLYLSLLGDYVKTSAKTGASMKRFCGRVFIKFCGRIQKLEELTDLGVFHVSCLYLTLAVGSSDQSIVLNLIRTLLGIPTNDIKEGKHIMIWKGIAASVLALTDMHEDLSGAAEIITGQITPVVPISHLMDAIKIIFETDPTSVKGLHLFIDSWIVARYPNCRDSNSENVMSMFGVLLRNLREPLRSGNKEAQILLSKAEEIIRPLLLARPSKMAAEVAGLFTVLSNRRMDLYQHWSEHRECDLAAVYLCCIYENGSDIVAAHLPQASSKVVQVWIRCMFASGLTEDNKKLSRVVVSLPQQFQLFQQNDRAHEDPLVSFFISYGVASTVNLNNQAIRQAFLSHFKGFDSWLEKHTSHLDQLPTQHLERLYQYTSAMIVNCPQFIYARCDATSLIAPLVNCVLLPRRIYDPDYCPPRNLTQALWKHLPHFIRGLIQLVPESDPYIWRLFKDTITHYIARYDYLPVAAHPFNEFFNTTSSIVRITKVLRLFFEIKDGGLHRNFSPVLRLLQHAATVCDVAIADCLFDSTVRPLIEVLITVDDKQFARILNYFSKLLTLESNRAKMLDLLVDSCKKHIAFNANGWFKMAAKISPLCSSALAPLGDLVEAEVLSVERKRGVERDNALRSQLNTLKSCLSSPVQQHS